VDDFGTGYSSLATLKNFPVDTIKIDRSFIRDLSTCGEDRALADAIISMGRTLSLTVVAEGVETTEQADFLRAHGCDEFQGFLFSRPVPAEGLRAYVATREVARLGHTDHERHVTRPAHPLAAH
jgi:EAL domain-containing protein (putative c-di-GMP-specific phosphodiesterase class I)